MEKLSQVGRVDIGVMLDENHGAWAGKKRTSELRILKSKAKASGGRGDLRRRSGKTLRQKLRKEPYNTKAHK
ncbi:hypothetical protein ACFX13_045850 [Malus domestica]